MRYCPKCGTLLTDDQTKFCPCCGNDLSAAYGPAGAPQTQIPQENVLVRMKKRSPAAAPLGLDKKTFLRNYSEGWQSCIAAAILGYICAGVTLVASFTSIFEYLNMFALIDVALLLVLSLLIHLLRSRVAAIILLVYSVYNTIIMLITQGMFAGWLGLVAGILAVVGSFKCVKEWKEYQARTQGTMPVL